MNPRRLFRRAVLSRPWATFLVLGAAFFLFALSSVNLVRLLSANLRLIADYGWQAVMDGALWQLGELMVTGFFSVSAYVVLKTCEHRLSDWLAHAD